MSTYSLSPAPSTECHSTDIWQMCPKGGPRQHCHLACGSWTQVPRNNRNSHPALPGRAPERKEALSFLKHPFQNEIGIVPRGQKRDSILCLSGGEQGRRAVTPLVAGYSSSCKWLVLAASARPSVWPCLSLLLCPSHFLPAPVWHRNPAYPHSSGLPHILQYSFAHHFFFFLDMYFVCAGQILI